MTTLGPVQQPELSFLDGRGKRLLIGGEWVESSSGGTLSTVNPSTGRTLAEFAAGTAYDVDLAVAAARRALKGPWAKKTPVQRQNLLWAFADIVVENYDELRLLDVLEMGAPINKFGPDPRVSAMFLVESLRYFAGWTTKICGETIPNSISPTLLSYTLKEPVGVVAAIVPWNSPLSNALWKIGPVLATGCTMILKPAEQASLTALRLGELLGDLELPEGVVNIVTGLGEVVGAALVEHPGVDKVAFTGSTETGRAIVRAAAGNLKRVSLELGGKSPQVILDDADLDRAIPAAAMGVFGNSGQMCVAGSRIYVQRDAYHDVVAGLARVADGLRVGLSLEPTTQIGPVVSLQQLERIMGYLTLSHEEGALTVTGGERVTDGALSDGFFVSPTVLADVRDDMRIAREEIFGPVACVMPFDTLDEVLVRANDSEFGLGSGVWTRDVGKAHRFAREMEAGTVWVNTYNQLDPAVPFGGYKTSGWGRELGPHSLEEYLNTKSIWINTD